MVAINLAYLRHHTAPGLYQSGVVYGRTTIWEPTPALYLPNKHRMPGSIYYQPFGSSKGEKRGDCKSLSAALVAEMLLKEIPVRPVFRFAIRPNTDGILDFHILLAVPPSISANGWKDPSRDLGMGADEVARFDATNFFGNE